MKHFIRFQPNEFDESTYHTTKEYSFYCEISIGTYKLQKLSREKPLSKRTIRGSFPIGSLDESMKSFLFIRRLRGLLGNQFQGT